MAGKKEQETGNLFTTVFKGKTYTCFDKQAYCWETFSSHDLTGQRVTVLQIDTVGVYAYVELASDRTKNFDVKLDTLKKC